MPNPEEYRRTRRIVDMLLRIAGQPQGWTRARLAEHYELSEQQRVPVTFDPRRFVLGFGRQVRVVKPQALAEWVRQEARMVGETTSEFSGS